MIEASKRTKYVVGFMTDGNRVALIRKDRPQWQAGKLNGIGGGVEEPYETFAQAMVREFREETGLDTLSEDWSLFARMGGGQPFNPRREHEWEIEFFIAFMAPGILDLAQSSNDRMYGNGEVSEQVEIVWLRDCQYGREDMIANLPWMIPAALDFHAKTSIAKKRPKLLTVEYL